MVVVVFEAEAGKFVQELGYVAVAEDKAFDMAEALSEPMALVEGIAVVA